MWQLHYRTCITKGDHVNQVCGMRRGQKASLEGTAECTPPLALETRSARCWPSLKMSLAA